MIEPFSRGGIVPVCLDNTEKKVTATLRMMAYDVPTHYIDDNLAMADITSIFYVKQFAKTSVWSTVLESIHCTVAASLPSCSR
jgi:hypothetical protein